MNNEITELQEKAKYYRTRLIDNIQKCQVEKELEDKINYLEMEYGLDKQEAEDLVYSQPQKDTPKNKILTPEEITEYQQPHFTNWRYNEENAIWKTDEEVEQENKMKEMYATKKKKF